jgi:hypothetical protein
MMMMMMMRFIKNRAYQLKWPLGLKKMLRHLILSVSTEKVPTIGQKVADLSEVAGEVSHAEPKPQPKLKPTLERIREPVDEFASIGGLLEMNVLPEPRRRAEQDPLVVSLGDRLNDDIYFIGKFTEAQERHL